jgi:hypothetical protein
VVLGGGADHGGAADVDILDAVVVGSTLGGGRLEGIEVDDQQIDRGDTMRLGRARVLGVAADGEEPAVHQGMQRLEAAVHHLGKAGVLGDVGDGDAGVFEGLGRAAGRQHLDAARGERAGKLDEPGLVGDRDQRPPDRLVSRGAASCRAPR